MSFPKSGANWVLALTLAVPSQAFLAGTAGAQSFDRDNRAERHWVDRGQSAWHVERVVVNDHWALHVTVESPEGPAECIVDATGIRYGDGYAMTYQIEVNNAAELLMRVAASGPSGTMEGGTIHFNRLTGKGSTDRLNDVAFVLSTSRQARLVRSVLPLLGGQVQSQTSRWTPVVNEANCGLLIAGVIACVDLAVAACAVPEPVEPYACAGSLAMLGIAAGAMADAGCTGGVDNTIGWG